MPANQTPQKKSSKKPATIDPQIIKQRRETVEKRILRLEEKLNKDRALLLRYAATEQDEAVADEAVAATEPEEEPSDEPLQA